MRIRVKICCIADVEEAQMAVAHGADAVGLVSAMPSGPGPIPDERIAEIARVVPPPVGIFLLTCGQHATAVIAQQRNAGANTLQLVDRFPVEEYADLRATLPGVAIVQVIHVAGAESVAEAVGVAPYVDALLLDSGNTSLPIKELGGTGRTHDWAISRTIRESVPVPVFLAGGLHSGNVAQAIREVQPFGVDICSGVRTNGQLDPVKLKLFMQSLNSQSLNS